MGITLKQIADMAGVHKSTVDKVIHNRPGVSDTKRQQIRALLQEHGYESNPLAKALNYQKKKMTIGVVLPLVNATPDLRRGIELVRQDFNSFNIEIDYRTIDYGNVDAQVSCLRDFRLAGVAGVVVSPMESEAVLAELNALHEANIPVVVVHSDLANAPCLCFVGQDMQQAGQVAARMLHLLTDSGKIGVVTSRHKLHSVELREQAFADYISHYPELTIADTIDTQESPDVAYAQTQAMLRRHADLNALFITCGCVTDVCRAVRDAALPVQPSIVCFERYPEIMELLRQGEITCTISGDLQEQGRLAMRFLFEYIIYDRTPECSTVYTKNEIIIAENA